MTTEKSISIACEGAAFLNLDELTEFQWELKSLSKTNYKRLRREILETGLGFPFRVWRNEGKFFIIGGHQTKRTLVQMRDLEGYHVPRLPVTWIYAKNHKQAKRRVLQDIAQYGKVDRQGLYEFITDSEIDIKDLMDSFEIPEVDLDIFKAEYVDNNVPEINEEEDIDDSEKSEEEIDELDILPPKVDALTKPGSKFKIGEHVLYNGDCLNILKTMIPDSLDSMVTDPPAGISFMGKDWDEDKGGSKEWTIWLSSVMSEALRVLKPGAHALVWAIPRTSHWTATALEDAGFEIRDVITHLFGSGFPKSLDISKAIDKAAGAKREVIGYDASKARPNKEGFAKITSSIQTKGNEGHKDNGATLTAPSTDAAKKYQGWGTALKPASEHWILVRKPLSEKTVAANILKHGTGGINIDGCRVLSDDKRPDICNACVKIQGNLSASSVEKKTGPAEVDSLINTADSNVEAHLNEEELTTHSDGLIKPDTFDLNIGMTRKRSTYTSLSIGKCGEDQFQVNSSFTTSTKTNKTTELKTCRLCHEPVTCDSIISGSPSGRFPANLVLDEEAARMLDEQSGTLVSKWGKQKKKHHGEASMFNLGVLDDVNKYSGDSGGASRFFYCAKASKSERNKGCEGLPTKGMEIGDERPSGNSWERRGRKTSEPRSNIHPTVKPIRLMQYLITLITPPDGTLLDCFGGSGSTLVAAHLKGFKSILIEQSIEYCDIILARAESITEKHAKEF